MASGQSAEEMKENNFPNQIHSNKDVFRPKSKRHRVRQGNHKDVQSLADAIKTCVPSLIKDVVFNELEDKAIENGCLTEDECSYIRNGDRKTQIRKVVLLITKRSFKTMNNFLEALHIVYPYLAQNIWKEYHMNIKKRPKRSRPKRQCPLCRLKNAVDVKNVIDDLYSTKIIDDNLYAEINSSRNEIGQQIKHWDAVLKACLRNQGIRHLLSSLEANDYFTHITNHVRNLFENVTGIKEFCTCLRLDKSLARIRTLSLDSSASNTPPDSSDSNCSRSSDDDIKSEPETEKGTPANGSVVSQKTYTKENDRGKMQIQLSETDVTYDPLMNSTIECSELGNKVRVGAREQPLLTVFRDRSNRPKTNDLFPATTENLHTRQRNTYGQSFPALKHHRLSGNERQQQRPGRFKNAVSSALVQLRVLKRFMTRENRRVSPENAQK